MDRVVVGFLRRARGQRQQEEVDRVVRMFRRGKMQERPCGHVVEHAQPLLDQFQRGAAKSGFVDVWKSLIEHSCPDIAGAAGHPVAEWVSMAVHPPQRVFQYLTGQPFESNRGAEDCVPVTDAVRAILDAEIPVMGHLGLTPQSVNQFGGYRVQGRSDEQAHRIVQDAKDLEAAGIARIELGRVRSALPQLSQRQREVLLAEIGRETPAMQADKMTRSRARRKLNYLVGRASSGEGASYAPDNVEARSTTAPEPSGCASRT